MCVFQKSDGNHLPPWGIRPQENKNFGTERSAHKMYKKTIHTLPHFKFMTLVPVRSSLPLYQHRRANRTVLKFICRKYCKATLITIKKSSWCNNVPPRPYQKRNKVPYSFKNRRFHFLRVKKQLNFKLRKISYLELVGSINKNRALN